MTEINYILNLLNFQEKDIDIIDITNDNDKINIKANANFDRQNISCPKCGSVYNNIHAYYYRKIKHINVISKQVILYVKIPRFICMENECQNTFNLELSFVKKSNKLSNELKQSINSETKKPKTFKMIAQEAKVSTTTVNNIFKNELIEFKTKLTEIICIDEFRADTNFGKYAFVLGDPVSGTILDILPDRKINYLLFYFQSMNIEEKNKVKYIVSDLFEPFRSFIKTKVLPIFRTDKKSQVI